MKLKSILESVMQPHLNPLEDAIKGKLSSLGNVFASAAENEGNERVFGTVTFRDGSVTGTTLLIAPCNANDTETMNIPDSGVLFSDGIHVVLSNIDRVTVFHS